MPAPKPTDSKADEQLDVYETFARDLIRSNDAGSRPRRIARIVVPTDFSLCSMWALRHAEELARRLEAEIVLVHVDQSLVPGSELAKTREAVARRELDALAALVRERSVPARIVLESGAPAEEIMRTAEREHAELVVMGTHGRHGLERALMGSIAESVVRRSPCPVLTVRHAQNG